RLRPRRTAGADGRRVVARNDPTTEPPEAGDRDAPIRRTSEPHLLTRAHLPGPRAAQRRRLRRRHPRVAVVSRAQPGPPAGAESAPGVEPGAGEAQVPEI